MPEIEFKGKQRIYAHHKTIPHRPLIRDDAKSMNSLGEEDNLIIHGDNLLALKALMPKYAGRIQCIYIDPPTTQETKAGLITTMSAAPS